MKDFLGFNIPQVKLAQFEVDSVILEVRESGNGSNFADQIQRANERIDAEEEQRKAMAPLDTLAVNPQGKNLKLSSMIKNFKKSTSSSKKRTFLSEKKFRDETSKQNVLAQSLDFKNELIVKSLEKEFRTTEIEENYPYIYTKVKRAKIDVDRPVRNKKVGEALFEQVKEILNVSVCQAPTKLNFSQQKNFFILKKGRMHRSTDQKISSRLFEDQTCVPENKFNISVDFSSSSYMSFEDGNSQSFEKYLSEDNMVQLKPSSHYLNVMVVEQNEVDLMTVDTKIVKESVKNAQ